MKLPVHRWFKYSAGFSSQWAQEVIRESGASRVLDPFAGSGTTMISAEEIGADSIGVDVHPFVTRVARAKLSWRLDAAEYLERAGHVLAVARRSSPAASHPSELIRKCFPDVASLQALMSLRDAVESERRGDLFDELLWLTMVSIIRACSPAGTAQWQYILPNKTKARVAEPFEAFRLRAELFASDMQQMQQTVGPGPSAQILTADARTLDGVPNGWADLVLTSPPYANNFDYADATRLEQTFLEEISGWGDLKGLRTQLMKSATQHMGRWDPDEALSSPLLSPIIGDLLPVYEELQATRQTRAGNKAYHLMVLGYFFDSAEMWRAIRSKTGTGGRACFVVGDSAPYGVHVPVERWLGELAVSQGFGSWTFEKVRDRNTKWKNRKHTHPLHEGRLWVEGV